MKYDVVLIHPPSIYDFRKQPIFYGPMALTVGESTVQFMTPPVGMLSIADYLDRNGYRVIVDNVGERMMMSETFDVEAHLASLSARVYSIGLHWCVHSQGAMEIAKMCKRLHPDALVILGGLSSTVFHQEIVRNYGFVDAVIRGEAEKPFLSLMKALDAHEKFEGLPNLTYRDAEGSVKSEPLMEPSADLDEYEFTRLDLLEPKSVIFTRKVPPHWSIPICRGCLHNCVGCGGSAYSYRTHLGRTKPAFRSPEKIAQDLNKLCAQGVQCVFLFQDPRMGGKEYWSRLFATLRREKLPLTQLSMELFGAADEEYIDALSKIGVPISLTMSPESCVDRVRKPYGRNYTNEELIKTIKACKRRGIPLGVFSMIALPNDTRETIRETWDVWRQICLINQKSDGPTPVHFAFGPQLLLDPGSHGFDFPASHGYRLLFKNLADYINGMSLPSWHQWISYETKSLDRDAITKLIVESLEQATNLREKYGVYNRSVVAANRYFVTASKLAVDAVNDAMNLDEMERRQRLEALRKLLDRELDRLSA
jgi:B12-binding domain/radical SAM domain protein